VDEHRNALASVVMNALDIQSGGPGFALTCLLLQLLGEIQFATLILILYHGFFFTSITYQVFSTTFLDNLESFHVTHIVLPSLSKPFNILFILVVYFNLPGSFSQLFDSRQLFRSCELTQQDMVASEDSCNETFIFLGHMRLSVEVNM